MSTNNAEPVEMNECGARSDNDEAENVFTLFTLYVSRLCL